MSPIAMRGAVAVFAAVVLLGTLAAALAERPQPEIFIPKMRHDYGNVFEQEKYEYSFTVHNRGKADLVIDRVKPG